MKNIKRFISGNGAAALAVMIFAAGALTSCYDDPQVLGIKEGPGEATIRLYTPVEGTMGSEISFYGSNLPTDLSKVRVEINGKEATVKRSNGRILSAEVQAQTGSGEVKVYIDGEQVKEFAMPQEFTYHKNMLSVTTYLGSTKKEEDGPVETAKFAGPKYIAWGNTGELIITELGAEPSTSSNYSTVRLMKDDYVKTLYTGYQYPSVSDKMRGIAFSKSRDTLFVANDEESTLSCIVRDGDSFGAPVTLLKKSVIGGGSILTVDVHPVTGDVFLGKYGNPCAIFKYDPKAGTITQKLKIQDRNVTLTAMVFSRDGKKIYVTGGWRAQCVYVADYDAATDTFSNLKVLAGTEGTAGNSDGTGTNAKFNEPMQMDVDEAGNVYVADSKNHCIRKITPAGVVTTYAGKAGTAGYMNGNASVALFNQPRGCKFGPDGALYVGDCYNDRIRRVVFMGEPD